MFKDLFSNIFFWLFAGVICLFIFINFSDNNLIKENVEGAKSIIDQIPADIDSLSLQDIATSSSIYRIEDYLLSSSTILVNNSSIKVFIATTSESMRRGLGGISNIRDDQGMIFDFGTSTTPYFWMKDMLFPIDIMWINEEKKIVGIESNISTSSYPSTFSPSVPIRYVLEINAGLAEKIDLKEGMKLIF
jgi:uncharacterized membrane protein (UPF0127 family)